mgnify:CR=1 FL=1
MAYVTHLENGTTVNSYVADDEYNNQIDYLKSVFGWGFPEYTLISDKFTDEYLKEEVIYGCLNRIDYKDFVNEHTVTVNRLFVLNGFWEDNPSWCHNDALIVAQSVHYEEDNKAFLTKAKDYKHYIIRASSTVSKNEFGLELKDDSDEFICVLVENNKIVATRKLVPTEGTGDEILENWQSLYLLYARKAGKKEFLKKLYESGL